MSKVVFGKSQLCSPQWYASFETHRLGVGNIPYTIGEVSVETSAVGIISSPKPFIGPTDRRVQKSW